MKKEELSREQFEKIEDFLLNKMSQKEQSAFEKEISLDADLSKEVDIQRELMLAVETAEMKNRLETMHAKTTQKRFYSQWYLVAASVAVLLVVGIWTLNRPGKVERLFATNVTVDPGLPVPMSATDNYVFYDAMVDYKTGKYEVAIGKWQPLLNEKPENDTLIYFVGVSHFNAEKYKESVPYFKDILKHQTSSFYGKAEWYLALNYLKLNDIDRLKALASTTQSNYADRIKQLIQKLE